MATRWPWEFGVTLRSSCQAVGGLEACRYLKEVAKLLAVNVLWAWHFGAISLDILRRMVCVPVGIYIKTSDNITY